MTTAEDALLASCNTLLETAINDSHKDLHIFDWEVLLNGEHAVTATGVLTAIHKEVPFEYKYPHIQIVRTEKGDGIAQKVRTAVKTLFAK